MNDDPALGRSKELLTSILTRAIPPPPPPRTSLFETADGKDLSQARAMRRPNPFSKDYWEMGPGALGRGKAMKIHAMHDGPPKFFKDCYGPAGAGGGGGGDSNSDEEGGEGGGGGGGGGGKGNGSSPPQYEKWQRPWGASELRVTALRSSIDALKRDQLAMPEWRQRELPPPKLQLYPYGHAVYDPFHEPPPRPFKPFRRIGLEFSDENAANLAYKVAHHHVLI